MTTTNFTTSLGIALPTTGDLSGTWGDTVNDYISKYLDAAVAGALTVSTDVTLLKTTNAALGATSSQYAILIASGHAANITVTAPAVSKVYLVINKSGSYTVKIRGAGPTTGITVPVSTAALVAWDGSDFVLISSTDVNSLSNVLTAVKGGTGQSSYAVGDLLYASSTTALSKLADVATGNALISGGIGVAPSYGKIGLTTHVSGTLPVANGGTGVASYTTNRILYATGATTLSTSANFTFNGTELTVSGVEISPGGSSIATNVAIGQNNPLGAITTGANNVGVGAFALKTSTTGNRNTSVGVQSMEFSLGASDNVGVGYRSLGNATSATQNVALGNLALVGASLFTGSSNVGIGHYAGTGITTGSGNLFIGTTSGESVSTGSYNILIGNAAGTTVETGEGNIIIGDGANSSGTGVNDEIVIGQALTAKGANTAYIGGSSGAYNQKNVTTWETTSDLRIKKNIAPFNQGLEVLNQIQVKNFEYRTKEEITELSPSVAVERSGVQIGIIAQELQQVLPGCVTQNSTGVLSVNTDSLVWYLINAVKQLSAEVEQLKQR